MGRKTELSNGVKTVSYESIQILRLRGERDRDVIRVTGINTSILWATETTFHISQKTPADEISRGLVLHIPELIV